MAHAADKISGVRHVYVCPMRWADLDMLGHVNNVTYVDYLQEARVDMLRVHAPTPGGEELAEGVVVVRHRIEFVAPLTLAESVTVECWVTEVRGASFTMAYEIISDADGARTVHLRASTVLAPFVFAEERPRRITQAERDSVRGVIDAPLHDIAAIPAAPTSGPSADYPLQVRWSDVDAYGHVNNVKYVEYFQESRIRFLWSLPEPEDGPWSNWVVGTTDIDYRRPILFRPEPYVVRSWITHVGNRSIHLVSEIREHAGDGADVLARARVVLVSFDPKAQCSAEMNPRQRERLLQMVAD